MVRVTAENQAVIICTDGCASEQSPEQLSRAESTVLFKSPLKSLIEQ